MSLYSVSFPCLFIFNNQSPILGSLGTCFRGSKLHPEVIPEKELPNREGGGRETGADREAMESFFQV